MQVCSDNDSYFSVATLSNIPTMTEMDRGLLLKPEWAELLANGTKSMEVRSHCVRCVKKDELVFIVASGQGRNTHGVTLLKVLGHMKFVEAIPIAHNEFQKFFHEHRVPQKTYTEMFANRSKGSSSTTTATKIYGWRFNNVVKLDTPCWIKWNNDSGI